MCETQVALNNMAFLVSEVSVFDKYHTTCLACAHVYVGCEVILGITPQNVIIVESQRCGLPTTKNSPFRLKCRWKRVQVITIDKTPISVVSVLGTWALAYSIVLTYT